jgi:hypothetical protein
MKTNANYKGVIIRNLSKVLRFGFMKRLRRGVRLSITPSWVCNYDCEYCSVKIKGVYPKSDIKPLAFWKQIITEYDRANRTEGGIREIILSGGEPTLIPYFKELVDWILFEKKWYLTSFSNLSNLKWLEIKPTRRLRIGATFHHGHDPIAFTKRYNKINKIHRVDVEEIGEKFLPYSTRAKNYLTQEEINTLTDNVRIDPMGGFHLNCKRMSEPFV